LRSWESAITFELLDAVVLAAFIDHPRTADDAEPKL